MRTRNSFWATLIGEKSKASDEVVLEEIRAAMLATLSKYCGSYQPKMAMELTFAPTIGDLWHKRPRLLQAISAFSSSEVAARELKHISSLFVGHYPNAR